jgi:hypothetical protein
MDGNSQMKGENTQLNTEQDAIEQMHVFACEMINCMENDDKTEGFSQLVVEFTYFMCDVIQSQPQWVEDWLNWWLMHETEDFGAIPNDTYANLWKQIERRLMFAKYIESM